MFGGFLDVKSLSSAARISSSSLDVGLGTRNKSVLADDVGVSGRWLDCGDSLRAFSVSDWKRGVSVEPKVLRAHADVVGKCRRSLCLPSITPLVCVSTF